MRVITRPSTDTNPKGKRRIETHRRQRALSRLPKTIPVGRRSLWARWLAKP